MKTIVAMIVIAGLFGCALYTQIDWNPTRAITLNSTPNDYTFIGVDKMTDLGTWTNLGWQSDYGTILKSDCVLRKVAMYGSAWSALCMPGVQPPPIPLSTNRVNIIRRSLSSGQDHQEYLEMIP